MDTIPPKPEHKVLETLLKHKVVKKGRSTRRQSISLPSFDHRQEAHGIVSQELMRLNRLAWFLMRVLP